MKACFGKELQQHINKVPHVKTTMEFTDTTFVKIWYNNDGPVAIRVHTDKYYDFIME